MNHTLLVLRALALALPLAIAAPTVVAQANDPAKSLRAPERGRQAVSNKLEQVRFDAVNFDGLPLSEVVHILRDETRKRDPEKKGINFMINPNAPPGAFASAPGAPPVEPIDAGSILIRINQLIDVRLVDVLDAVVKVADHPVKYSIEDYGVVFAPAGSDATPKYETSFSFEGGDPRQFLDAVQKQYGVDWLSVADIPREMEDLWIPKLRINQESLVILARRPGGTTNPLGALISLYNQLGEQKPALGRLIVQGDFTKPSVVMFVPDKAVTEARPKIKVKAFSLYGTNDAERERLQEDIARAQKEAMEYAYSARRVGSSNMRQLDGTVAIHKDTSLLVATGSEPYVDMVESIVTACVTKARQSPPSSK